MQNKQLPQHIKHWIDHLNEDELHFLYSVIGQRLNLLHKTKALFAMREFAMLDRVYFDHNGERIEGIVTRFNQRTITVTLDDGNDWKVSPDFLKKVEEKKPISEIFAASQNREGLGRNDKCWCGSGKKYKKCHWPN